MTDHENLDGMTLEGRLDYWRRRALKAEQGLEDLKDIGRAKAYLLREGLFPDEPAAHRHIQKRAMDERQTMGAIAREIVMTGVVKNG